MARTHADTQRFVHIALSGKDAVGMGERRLRNRRHRQGEIACVVHPDVWGSGVGTAIGQALLSRGFAEFGLHRIYATCAPRNRASARVLGRLGMT